MTIPNEPSCPKPRPEDEKYLEPTYLINRWYRDSRTGDCHNDNWARSILPRQFYSRMDKASKLHLLHVQGCDHYFESRKLPATERERMKLSDIFDLSFGAMYDVISQPPYSDLWAIYTEQEQELIVKWEIQAKWQSWITQIEWENGDSQRHIESSQCGEIVQMIELGIQEDVNVSGNHKASQWLEEWLDIFLYNTSLEDDVFLGSRTWSYLSSCGNASLTPGSALSLSGWKQQLNNFRFRHALDIKLEDAITCFSYGADFVEIRLHRFIQEGGNRMPLNYIRRAISTISLCVDHQIDLLFRYNVENNEVVPVMGIKDRQSVQRFLLQQLKDCRNPKSREILNFWYNSKFVPYVKWNLICVGYLWAALTITTLLAPTKFVLCFNEHGPVSVLNQFPEVWGEIEGFLGGLEILLQDIKIKRKTKKKGRKGGLKHLATSEPVAKEIEYNGEEVQVHSEIPPPNAGGEIRKNISGTLMNDVHKLVNLETNNLLPSLRNTLEVNTREISKTVALSSADNPGVSKPTFDANQKQDEDAEKNNVDRSKFSCETGYVGGPSHILTAFRNKDEKMSGQPATAKMTDQLSIAPRPKSILPETRKPDHVDTTVLSTTGAECSGSGMISVKLTETEEISKEISKVDIYPISNTRKMGMISVLSTTFGKNRKRKVSPTATESRIPVEWNDFDKTGCGNNCMPVDTLGGTEVSGSSEDNHLVINNKEEKVLPLEENDCVEDSFPTRWDELEKELILKQQEERALGIEWPKEDAQEEEQRINPLIERTNGRHYVSAAVDTTAAIITDCSTTLVSPKSLIPAKNGKTEVYLKRTSTKYPQERKQVSTPTRHRKETKQASVEFRDRSENQKKISLMNDMPDTSPLGARCNGKQSPVVKGREPTHTIVTPEQHVNGFGKALSTFRNQDERASGKSPRRSKKTPVKREDPDTLFIASPTGPCKVLFSQKSEETESDVKKSTTGSHSTRIEEGELEQWERLSDFENSYPTEKDWKLIKKPDKRKAKRKSPRTAMPLANIKPSQNIDSSGNSITSEKPKPPENTKLSENTRLYVTSKLSENSKAFEKCQPSENHKVSEKPRPSENFTLLKPKPSDTEKPRSSKNLKLLEKPKLSETPKLSEKPKPSENLSLSDEYKPPENRLQSLKSLGTTQKREERRSNKHFRVEIKQEAKDIILRDDITEENIPDSVTKESGGANKLPLSDARSSEKQTKRQEIPPKQTNSQVLEKKNWASIISDYEAGGLKLGAKGTQNKAPKKVSSVRDQIIENIKQPEAEKSQILSIIIPKGCKIFSSITKSTDGEGKTETEPERNLSWCPLPVESTTPIHAEPVQSKPAYTGAKEIDLLDTIYPTPKSERRGEIGPENHHWGWPPLVKKSTTPIPPKPVQDTDAREVNPLTNTYAATLKSEEERETGPEKNVWSWPPLGKKSITPIPPEPVRYKVTGSEGDKPLDNTFQRQLNTAGAKDVIIKTHRTPSKEQQQESEHDMGLFENRSKHENTLRTKENQTKSNINTPTGQKAQQVQKQRPDRSRKDQTLQERRGNQTKAKGNTATPEHPQAKIGDRNNPSNAQVTVESLVEKVFNPKSVTWAQEVLDLHLVNPKKEKTEHISTKQKPHKSPTIGKLVEHETIVEKLKREMLDKEHEAIIEKLKRGILDKEHEAIIEKLKGGILEKEQESVSLRVQLELNEELVRKDKTIRMLEQEISGRDAVLSLCHARIRDLIQDRFGLVTEATELRCFIDVITHGTAADRARAMLDGHMSIQRPILRSACVNSLGQFIENRPVLRSPSHPNRPYTNTDEHDIVAILDGINPKLDQQPLVEIYNVPNIVHTNYSMDHTNPNFPTLDLAPPGPPHIGQVGSTVTQQIPPSELQLPPPLLGTSPGGIQDPNFPYVSVDTYPLHSGSGPKTFLPSAPLLPRRQVGTFGPREEKSKNHMPTQKRNVPSVRGPSPLRPLSTLRRSPAIHRRNSLPLRNIRSSSNPAPPKVRSQNHQDQQRRRGGTSQNSLAKQTLQENNPLFPGNMHDNPNITPPGEPLQNAQHHQMPGDEPWQNSPSNQNLQESNSLSPNNMHHNPNLIPPSQNPQHYQRPADGSSQNSSVKENSKDKNTPRSPVIVNGSCQIPRSRH